MEVFRISKELYSYSLSSSGSANRWNLKGQKVIYTGSSRSLSTLELVVHRNAIEPEEPYKVMVIHIPDNDNLFRQVKIADLPVNWKSMAAYSVLQQIGSNWYKQQDSLVLKIPSAVIPQEYNYLINTIHPDFEDNIRLLLTENYFWDDRLF